MRLRSVRRVNSCVISAVTQGFFLGELVKVRRGASSSKVIFIAFEIATTQKSTGVGGRPARRGTYEQGASKSGGAGGEQIRRDWTEMG